MINLMIKIEPYFSAFSGWIENLGVVPLLLLRAFLLLPILVFLAALLFLVTLVLETIFQLLNVSFFYITHGGHKLTGWVTRYPRHKIINLQKLRPSVELVKGGIVLFLLIPIMHCTQLLADTSFQTLNKVSPQQEITLARGEIQKLSLKSLKKFTVGNKEVLAVKSEGTNGLLLRGQTLGHSDLLIWRHGQKNAERYQVFVIRKAFQLKLKQLDRFLRKLPLQKEYIGKKLKLKGELKTLSHYQSFNLLYSLHKEKLVIKNVTVAPELQREIYANLLKDFAENNLFEVPCLPQELFIKCKLSRELSKDLSSFKEDYLIKWQDEKITMAAGQYQVTFTIQQFENAEGKAFNFGLSKIEGQLGDILLRNPLSLIDENPISLKEDKFRSQTLAHPILKGRPRSPIKIRIGQEIPFLQNVTNGVASQQWKFAGLGIDLTIVPHSHRLLVKYKTNLSRPDGQSITQNLQTSELLVELETNTVLFDIGFRVKESMKQQLPGLGKIPLFGSLFKGSAHQQSYKKILCLIKVEEI